MPKNQFTKYCKEKGLEKSFNDSKTLLQNCVTLAYPNPKNPLSLSCDASATAVGAVLEEYQDGHFKPLGFWSKHLPQSKQNWSCFRRELLAI